MLEKKKKCLPSRLRLPQYEVCKRSMLYKPYFRMQRGCQYFVKLQLQLFCSYNTIATRILLVPTRNWSYAKQETIITVQLQLLCTTHESIIPQLIGSGLNFTASLQMSSLILSSVNDGCSKSKQKGLGQTGSSLIS